LSATTTPASRGLIEIVGPHNHKVYVSN
jgi:hypothetical protein